MADSLEQQFEDQLNTYGVKFVRPERLPDGKRVDYFLPEHNLYVELKAHPSPRLDEQLESCGPGASIMVLCGPNSVDSFVSFALRFLC